VSSQVYSKLILEGSSNREFDLDQPEMLIGRDPSLDIVIEAPGVSRRHARIYLQGEQQYIEDLGSSNGTYVNDTQISHATGLQHGDRVGLGSSVWLRFETPPALETALGGTEDMSREAFAATMLESPETVVPDVFESAPPAQPAPEAELGTAGPADTRISGRASPPAERPAEPQDVGATILGTPALEMPRSDEPPRLAVTVAGEETRVYTLTQAEYTIGRASENDIVINSKIVSRSHGKLVRDNGGYTLVPSPDAGNPIQHEGRPLSGPTHLRHDAKLRIGGQDPGSMVSMIYTSPAEMAAGAEVSAITFGDRPLVTIGRDPSNDVVLNVPNVSRFHAQVERVGQRYRIRDLRSSNGTFVNDQRVEGEVWLQADDTIRIGSYAFVMGQNQLAQYDEAGGLLVEVIGLNKWVRKDLNILQDISVVFQPREFIVVVGQSGGGKSTLVDAIAGYRPATHGRVVVNGIDVYRNFDAIRNNIGFVPQRDIIHMELTIFEALDYAARLRMPPDTTKPERHQRVEEVLEDLDLAHRKDVQISGLSGGQQKRVSIGVELLTKPGLFFLDEPTSGLDPGTETALMQLMRRLADQGRTIVLITHATKNVMLADKVIFLARGGYLAWFGPPDEALRYFDQYRSERERRARDIEFDEIYAILDDSRLGSPTDWAERYRGYAAYQQYIVQPLQGRGHEFH
jgi:ABC-type multidrug transport system ATPase subunit